MTVRYTRHGTTPSYECNQVHKERAGRTCQFVRGDGVDAAVAELFLQAIQPAQLEVSLATLAEIDAQARQMERQWQLRLERARYEADLARRRFVAVDPENRLVARSLERDWNVKLTTVEQLEREFATVPTATAQRLGANERQQILALAEDLPALWHAPTTTAAERKHLLRLLLKDVTLTKENRVIMVALRWQTDACMTVTVPRPPRSADARRTPTPVVERIRNLALQFTDRQIADRLNEEETTTGTGGTFTVKKVQWLRWRYRIRSACPEGPAASVTGQRADGRYSAKAAAALLNVDVSTIAAWCKSGRLDAIQTTAHGPRWICLTPEQIAELRKPVQRRRQKRSAK
jgi:hypothetical protein